MEDSKIIKLIENTLSNKIKKDPNYIRYTFYELRVKYNLSEGDADRFLILIRTKLENEKYKVYFTGAKFEYNNAKITVQDSELCAKKNKVLESIAKTIIILKYYAQTVILSYL